MLPTDLLIGQSWISAPALPVSLCAVMGDLRPRFIPKCRVGQGYRAIARNGRVLLASDVPLSELVNRVARLRLLVWNRAILPGDRPEPFGIILDVRVDSRPAPQPLYQARLTPVAEASSGIAVDVGGGSALLLEPP